MTYETENWPRVQARHYSKTPAGTRRTVRVIVIHAMEAPEGPQTAENVARWFAQQPADTKNPSSVHINVDSDSIVQSVLDNDMAYGAAGANPVAIHVELAGYARQTLREWMDPYGIQLLNRAADAVAQYCLKYEIPPARLTDTGLASPLARGIVGHDQVTRVFKRSTHTDPGPSFPWSYFVAAVQTFHSIRK